MDSDEIEHIKTLCSVHLCGSWSAVDAINATPVTGGCINRIYRCFLTNHIDPKSVEPSEVIVRIITGDNPAKTAGEAGEAVAFHIIAKVGLGPKLLGVFNGGRIEEFIPGRMLHVDDLKNPNIVKMVAKKLAKFHSLDIPLPKYSNDCANVRDYIISSLSKGKTLNFSVYDERAQSVLEDVLNFDYLRELDWVISAKEQVVTRIVTCHSDFYANNILLRHEVDMNEVKDEDVLIIDIECIQRDSRGVDIGRMLHEANFDFTIMEQPKVVGPISEQLEERFVSSYLEQWKEDNGDLFDPELDNVQHVMLESKLNVLTTALSYCAGNFESLKEGEFTEFNDQILQYFAERKELYLSYKSSLISSLSS